MVRRLVDGVINQGGMDELATVFAEEAAQKTPDEFESFREAFPDWQMELKEMGGSRRHRRGALQMPWDSSG